jgi:hypothetical protein
MQYIIQDNQSYWSYQTWSKTSMVSNYDVIMMRDISKINDIVTT